MEPWFRPFFIGDPGTIGSFSPNHPPGALASGSGLEPSAGRPRTLLHPLGLPRPGPFFQWLSGNPGYPVHFFRVLFNLVSAVGLFFVAFHWIKEDGEPFLIKTLQALVGMERSSPAWACYSYFSGFLGAEVT